RARLRRGAGVAGEDLHCLPDDRVGCGGVYGVGRVSARTRDLAVRESLLEIGEPDWTKGERNRLWPLNVHSEVYGSSLIVKAGAGKLYGFTVYNSNVGTQFIQLHDCSGLPAKCAVP